jgi:AraC-like DNA-binding protein
MDPIAHPTDRMIATTGGDAFATIAGATTAIDAAFPILPFSSRESSEWGVRNLVDPNYGEGARQVSGLPNGMRMMCADFAYNAEVAGTGPGRNFLKFHYKLSGRNLVKFAQRPDTLLETGRSVIAYHPEGLDKEDCFAPGVREVSLTIGCRREAVLEALAVSADELPAQIRRYFDCPNSDFLCDELPLTMRMKEALADLSRPSYSPWLRQIHVEAKVLDLICMSLQELSTRDPFASPTVALKARDIEMLHAVRQSLESDFAEAITIADLCRRFATNRSKLSEGFRMIFGKTIFEYVHGLRMDHARLLLSETETPIADIAEQVGYSRQSSFSTAFRDYHGFRPLDVRRGTSPR